MGNIFKKKFKNTKGAFAESSYKKSVDRMTEEGYAISNGGYFGIAGDASDIRIIITPNPEEECLKFFNIFTEDGKIYDKEIEYGGIKELADGTMVTYRLVTSTVNSPAVDIKYFKDGISKKSKIHFMTEETYGTRKHRK